MLRLFWLTLRLLQWWIINHSINEIETKIILTVERIVEKEEKKSVKEKNR